MSNDQLQERILKALYHGLCAIRVEAEKPEHVRRLADLLHNLPLTVAALRWPEHTDKDEKYLAWSSECAERSLAELAALFPQWGLEKDGA
ncbi:hypothetical protein ACNCQC_004634 [Escherichia coli]